MTGSELRIGPHSVLVPRSGLAVESFDDALLVWDEERRRLHRLDLVAAIVWDELDGRALDEVAEALAREFDQPKPTLLADLVTLGQQLVTEGLCTADVRSDAHANEGGVGT